MNRSFCLIGLLALAGCSEAPAPKPTATTPTSTTSPATTTAAAAGHEYTLHVPNMT
jgi:hypothetical protein